MALIWYGHFDSTAEDRRILLAEDLARFFRGFVTDGIRNGGSCLQITEGGGLSVKMDNGVANIQGYMFNCDTDHTGRYFNISIPSAHSQYPRIDRIVLRLDRTIQTRNIMPTVLMGVAGANPVAPALTRNENIYELSLAQVRVNANALNISASNITDERFQNELCGIMHSVLGLDSSSWQDAFDRFLAGITETSEGYKENLRMEFNGFLNDTKTVWATWFAQINIDLQTYVTFDFNNLSDLHGTTKVTSWPAGKCLEVITITGSSIKVAERELDYGTFTTTEKVYSSDGSTLLRTSTNKRTFEGQTIKDVITT